MNLLTDASKQLFSRPDDEHFDSMDAIVASAKAYMNALNRLISVGDVPRSTETAATP